MRKRAVPLALCLLALASRAGAELPPYGVQDIGEPGSLARLYRGPDDRLHLLYSTSQGFHWRVWDGAKWNDAGLVPDTVGQGKSKFNNPSIVALSDGSFHVLWGPVASFGTSHDVYLQSHDGSAWGARQTVLPDYTEYVELVPRPNNQLMIVGGIVCPVGCTTPHKLAYSTGAPSQPFSAWTALPIAQAEGKTPFAFVQPGSDVVHVVSRWAKVSYLRFDGSQFGAETLLFPGSPYSVALPTVSAGPDGTPVVAGVEWTGSGTNWAIDHVRLARGDGGGGWIAGAQGEQIDSVEVDKSAVSADSQGGVHLFYVKKSGELSYRHSKGNEVAGPAVVVSGVKFSGPETENIAVSYTAHHVHVIVPTATTLKHVLIETDPVAADAGADAGSDSGAAGASGTGGGSTGGSGGGSAGNVSGTVPADDAGCGCRVGVRPSRSAWETGAVGLALAVVSLARRRRRQRGHRVR